MLSKKKTKQPLINASQETAFWVCDGRVLRNLKDLERAFSEMSGEAFRYHLSNTKNDFAKWIEEVLQDKELAQEIKKIKTQQTCFRKVEERLKKFYQ